MLAANATTVVMTVNCIIEVLICEPVGVSKECDVDKMKNMEKRA